MCNREKFVEAKYINNKIAYFIQNCSNCEEMVAKNLWSSDDKNKQN